MSQTKGMIQVPDTLDLAEYGDLAINGVLGTTNPDLRFECYVSPKLVRL